MWYADCFTRRRMENEKMSHDDSRTEGTGQPSRRVIWSRLRGLGLLHETDLIRIHRIAQQQRISPELAAIALGIVTRRQVLEG